jgi:hypothetical protein
MTTTHNSQKTDASSALPAARQFDFWIGEWDVTWADGGKGTNTISRILDDRVIHESFNASPSGPLQGMSVSVCDQVICRQTWVDNNGSYLDFVGEFRDGKMDLRRRATLDGKPILQRMVWYNIAQDALDWNWERSEDNGATWTVLWQIHYERRR